MQLQNRYYQTYTATNGKEAIDMLEEVHPDIIIIDAIMPEMDGFTATKIIKNHSNYAHIPIIMLTALHNYDDRMHGLSSGADDFINKPANIDMLVLRIKTLTKFKMMYESLHTRNSIMNKSNGNPFIEQLLNEGNNINNASVLIMGNDKVKIKECINLLNKHSIVVENDFNDNAFDECIIKFNNLYNKPNGEICYNEYNLILLCYDNDKYLADMISKFSSNINTRNVPIIGILNSKYNVDHITKDFMKNIDFLNKMFEHGMHDYISYEMDEGELLARCTTQIKKYRFYKILQYYYLHQNMNLNTDYLTKLYNKSYFEKHLNNLIQSYNNININYKENNNKNLLVLIIDCDNFKLVNDEYGHIVGNFILQEFSNRLLQNIRITDICARWGGEEFTVIISDVNLEEANIIVSRILNSIANVPFNGTVGEDVYSVKCTCSIGGSFLKKNESYIDLMKRADKYMYKAKSNGKNCFIID